MRLPRVRFTMQRMMIAVLVISIPLALWCWRINARFAFPSMFDFVPLAHHYLGWHSFEVLRVALGSEGVFFAQLGGGWCW